MLTVRKANLSDAKMLSVFAEQTFRETFGGANADDDMALHCKNSYGEAIQGEELSNPNRLTLLAEEDGELIGYAQLRWEAAPACVASERPGEIQRLYVRSGRHGKGVAQSLMDACLEEMKAKGTDVVWLGVWERNPRAIAFYKKYDFVEVGDHVFPLGNDPQRDIVMARSMVGS